MMGKHRYLGRLRMSTNTLYSPYFQEFIDTENSTYMRVKRVLAHYRDSMQLFIDEELCVGVENGEYFISLLVQRLDTGERVFMKYVTPSKEEEAILPDWVPYLNIDEENAKKILSKIKELPESEDEGRVYLYFDTPKFSESEIRDSKNVMLQYDGWVVKSLLFKNKLVFFTSTKKHRYKNSLKLQEHDGFAFLSAKEYGLYIAMRMPRRGIRKILSSKVHFGMNEVDSYPKEFEWVKRFKENNKLMSVSLPQYKDSYSSAPFSIQEWSNMVLFKYEEEKVALHLLSGYGLFRERTYEDLYVFKISKSAWGDNPRVISVVVPPGKRSLASYLTITDNSVTVQYYKAANIQYSNVPQVFRPTVGWFEEKENSYLVHVALPPRPDTRWESQPALTFLFPKVSYTREEVERLTLTTGLRKVVDAFNIEGLKEAGVLPAGVVGGSNRDDMNWVEYLGDMRFRTATGTYGYDEILRDSKHYYVLNIDDFLKDMGLEFSVEKEATQQLTDESEVEL